MINREDFDVMSPFEKQLLRNTEAIALWTLLTFLAVVFAPALLVVLSLLGY